jgi:hypothetical protein
METLQNPLLNFSSGRITKCKEVIAEHLLYLHGAIVEHCDVLNLSLAEVLENGYVAPKEALSYEEQLEKLTINRITTLKTLERLEENGTE